MLKVHDIKDLSTVDGEGIRLVIFTQGCHHACKGCHSPHTWNYDAFGYKMTNEQLFEYIKARLPWIDGITLSGGDPLFQRFATQKFLNAIRLDKDLKDINIWLYTGYNFEDIPDTIKRKVNTIVDGKYQHWLPAKRYRGSSNQRIFTKYWENNKMKFREETKYDI